RQDDLRVDAVVAGLPAQRLGEAMPPIAHLENKRLERASLRVEQRLDLRGVKARLVDQPPIVEERRRRVGRRLRRRGGGRLMGGGSRRSNGSSSGWGRNLRGKPHSWFGRLLRRLGCQPPIEKATDNQEQHAAGNRQRNTAAARLNALAASAIALA